jgi:predicted  nucleic acid-binding Zn-ribbon protein
MDSSRILVALQEQDKWRDRRTRLDDRLRSVRARKRFLQRELDAVRRRVARLEEAVGGQADRARRDVSIASAERIR